MAPVRIASNILSRVKIMTVPPAQKVSPDDRPA
jgi:hypothetical protein